MSASYDIAVIVGSLRKAAYSLRIAEAMVKLAPAPLKLDIVTLHGLSFYNQDLDGDHPPADWTAFRDRIKAAAGVVFVTPEYNRSTSGVLKNAIDVGSRPFGKSVFNGKAVGIVGNSPGALGGMAAAMHLKQILPGISGPILQQPEMYLNGVGDAFDEAGNLTKESLRDILDQYLAAYAALVRQVAA